MERNLTTSYSRNHAQKVRPVRPSWDTHETINGWEREREKEGDRTAILMCVFGQATRWTSERSVEILEGYRDRRPEELEREAGKRAV